MWKKKVTKDSNQQNISTSHILIFILIIKKSYYFINRRFCNKNLIAKQSPTNSQ